MKKATIFLIFTFVTLLSIAPIGFALYPSTTPWSMYRYDANHSGATPSDVPSTNNTLWLHGFQSGGSSVTTTPLVVDGKVIFAVRDLAVAVDETTGVELWRHQTPGVLTASTYADGRVFFGISEGTGGVTCINASTGTEIWTQDASPYFVKSSPLVREGIVYVGFTDNYTRAFEAANGHYVANSGYKTNGPVYSSPAADGDFLFFGSDDGNLYALNVSGSTPVSVWNFTANGAVRSTPTICNGNVFFGSDNRTLYALNETTGELIWSWTTTETSARIRNGVAVANNIVYVTPESTSGYTADMGKIYALHADVSPGNYTETDFEIRYWTKQFAGYLFNEPVYANGKIIVSARADLLFVFDADVGNTLWESKIHLSPQLGNAVAADGRVWFSAYWWDWGSFYLYCIGDPFPPRTDLYRVNAGGSSFDVALETNSTVTNFNTTALEAKGKISFKVQGIGATDMSNITLPDALLGGPFNITVDGEQPSYLAPATNNGTHTSLYFTYNGTIPHIVEITGTTFIPEFPIATIAPMLITMLFITLVKLKRKRNK